MVWACFSGGGGGGSFVYAPGATQPLVAAGGGGGLGLVADLNALTGINGGTSGKGVAREPGASTDPGVVAESFGYWRRWRRRRGWLSAGSGYAESGIGGTGGQSQPTFPGGRVPVMTFILQLYHNGQSFTHTITGKAALVAAAVAAGTSEVPPAAAAAVIRGAVAEREALRLASPEMAAAAGHILALAHQHHRCGDPNR